MASRTFPADPAYLSDLVNFAAASLSKHSHSKEKLYQYPLLFEELALKLIQCAGPDAQITVTVTRQLSRTTVQFRCPGSLVRLDPEDDRDYGGQILAGYRDYIAQSYPRGVNTITFSSPMTSVDGILPGLCAIGLAVLISVLLLVFLEPEQLLKITDALIDPVIRAFSRALQAFSTPAAFFCLSALVIGLRYTTSTNRGTFILILRYIETSILAIVTGFVVCTVVSYFALPQAEDVMITTSNEVVDSGLDFFLSVVVPDNLVDSFTSSNPIPMLVLALIAGYAASSLFGKFGEVTRLFIFAANSFFSHVINLLSGLLPIFLFFAVLSCGVSFKIDKAVTVTFVRTIALNIVIFFASTLVLFLIYALLLRCSGVSPLRFLRDYREIILANFRIGSNVQALPYNRRTLSHKVKLPHKTLSDLLVIGASINLNGNGLILSHTILFTLYFNRVSISITKFIMIAIIILLLSIGIPNQPCSFMIAMAITVPFLGLPDWMFNGLLIQEFLLARSYSFLNSLGDLVTVAIVDHKYRAKSENVPSP